MLLRLKLKTKFFLPVLRSEYREEPCGPQGTDTDCSQITLSAYKSVWVAKKQQGWTKHTGKTKGCEVKVTAQYQVFEIWKQKLKV